MPAPEPIAHLIDSLKSDAPAFLREGHKELFIASAPGRLDVMGGLTDYAGGLVCQYPLDVMTAVAVQRRDDRRLVIRNYNSDASPDAPLESTVALSLDDFYGTAALLPHNTLQELFAGGRAWAGYVAGAFPILARHKNITRRTHGANIACFTNIPLRGGIASSSALCCATLWAMTAAYNFILDPKEIPILAQRIENQIAGTVAGVAESTVSMLGRKNELMRMTCNPHSLLGFEPVPAGLLLAGIHLGRKGFGDTAEYRRTRVGASMALAMLGRFYQEMGLKDPSHGYLLNFIAPLFQRYFRHFLPERITGRAYLEQYGPISDRVVHVEPEETYMPRLAAEYHMDEHARVQAFERAWRDRAGDVAALGREAGSLMYDSHRARGVQAGLGLPEADVMVDLIRQCGEARGLFGARGGGTGGSVTVLAADKPEVREELAALAGEYQRRTGLVPRVLIGSAAGAGESAPTRVPVSQVV